VLRAWCLSRGSPIKPLIKLSLERRQITAHKCPAIAVQQVHGAALFDATKSIGVDEAFTFTQTLRMEIVTVVTRTLKLLEAHGHLFNPSSRSYRVISGFDLIRPSKINP
jgi:hypothetical protein